MLLSRGTVFVSSGLAGVLFLLSACAPIQLVSNYDEVIDQEAQSLQKKMDAYFISLQNSSPDARKFKNQQKFYEGALADLNSMQVRAGGIYKNKLTMEQIDLAKENLAYLVLLNKGCVAAPLTAEQKQKVKSNGIDLSMDCKKDNGASEDSAGRGEIVLNQFVVSPIQALFNQHLGAIMALELAKKRGEKQ
jgi:hypothetical protein